MHGTQGRTTTSQYNIELKHYFGTEGKIPRQKPNFPGQHRQYEVF